VDVDEQNRDDEPPEFSHAAHSYDDDEEYVAPEDDYDDGYQPPEPPARKGDLSKADDEIPFE
jgi:hypothetical protein